MEGGSYLLTNLNQNTTYSISIVAVNVQGESVASETVQILLTDFGKRINDKLYIQVEGWLGM